MMKIRNPEEILNESRDAIETTFKDNNKSFQMHIQIRKWFSFDFSKIMLTFFSWKSENKNFDENPEFRKIYWMNQGK